MKALLIKLVVVLTALLLQSCQDSEPVTVSIKVPNPVAVHYTFLDSTDEVDMHYQAILAVSSADSIDVEEIGTVRMREGSRLGFHYYQGDKCFLVLVKPSKISYEEFEQTLGHEMVHCLVGKFHGTDGVLPKKLIIGEVP